MSTSGASVRELLGKVYDTMAGKQGEEMGKETAHGWDSIIYGGI